MQPLNAVISAAKEAADAHSIELIGFIKGWQGILDKDYVKLSDISIDPAIGGTILKSSRVNLEKVPAGSQLILENLRELDVAGLIVIGGEDTLSNCFHIEDFPQILISKTIDNDVGLIKNTGAATIKTTNNTSTASVTHEDIINYFTLGHPTAAGQISAFVSLSHGLRTTAYSHERLMVVESMGMHAGWLALSSGMGHPDFIIIPEFPIDYEKFKTLVCKRYLEQRHLIIVVAEGSRWKDGTSFSADEKEKDGFGHPRFKGAAEVLAKKLKQDLRDEFDTRNVNGVNPSYLYRSGAPGDLDRELAGRLGREAVRLLCMGVDAAIFLTIQRKLDKFSLEPYPLRHVKGIGSLHRFVDERFYNPQSYMITENGKNYLSAIVDELPSFASYCIHPI